MDKVIKVTDDEVFVGRENGSIIKTSKENVSFDAEVGDGVEIFSNGNMIILNLTKKMRNKNNKNKNHSKFFELCQKVFPIMFFTFFVIFFIMFCIINLVECGNKYVFKANFLGVEVSSSLNFSDNECALDASMDIIGYNEVSTYNYKIVGKKLYFYNYETKKWVYQGTISATKVVVKEKMDNGMELTIVYKESVLYGLNVTAIVLFSISLALEIVSLVLWQLYKKGIIKGLKKEENMIPVPTDPVPEQKLENYLLPISNAEDVSVKQEEEPDENTDVEKENKDKTK